MDPLSLATGVITLVQAVAETVKFAKLLKESFSKASRNDEKAQLLIEELLETVTFIENCYSQHQALLEGPSAKPLLDILLQLRDALAEVVSECEKLKRPERPTSRIARGKIAVRSWFDGDNVGARIEGLRTLAEQCHSRLIRYTQINSAVVLTQVRESITRLESTITQHLAIRRVVREPSKTPKLPSLLVTNPSEINHIFAPDAPLSVPRKVQLSATHVTNFLRGQAADLDWLLSRILTSGEVLIPKPGDFDEPQSERIVTIPHATSFEILQQHLLSQTSDLRCILEDRGSLSADSLIQGADSLIQISEAYHHTLRSPQEASTLSSWAVSFYRQAYQAYPDTYGQPLAHSLMTSAAQLLDCDNEARATTNIVEALRLYRNSLSTNATPVNKIDVAKALTLFSRIAQVGGDFETSGENDAEAIHLLQQVVMEAYATLLVEDVHLDPRSFKKTRTAIEITDWRVQALLAYGYAHTQANREDGLAVAHQIFLKLHQCLPDAFSSTLFDILRRRSNHLPAGKLNEDVQYLSDALVHFSFLPCTMDDDITHGILKYSLYMDYAYRLQSLLSKSKRPATPHPITVIEAYEIGRACAEGMVKALAAPPSIRGFTVTSEIRTSLDYAVFAEWWVLSRLHGGPGSRRGWYDSQGNPSGTTSPQSPSALKGDHSLHSRHVAIRYLVDETSERARQCPQTLTNSHYSIAFLLFPVVHGRLVKLDKLEDASQVAWQCIELARRTPESYLAQAQNRRLVITALHSITCSRYERHSLRVIQAIPAVIHEPFPTPTPTERETVADILIEYASCVGNRDHAMSAATTESLKRYLAWYHQTRPCGAKTVDETVLHLTATLSQGYLSAGEWSAVLEYTGPLLDMVLKTTPRPTVDSERSPHDHLCVAIAVLHATALQRVGCLTDAFEYVTKTASYFSNVDERPDPQPGDDAGDGAGMSERVLGIRDNGGAENQGSRLIPPPNHDPSNKRPDTCTLFLLSMRASLLSQQGCHSRPSALATDAMHTINIPDWLGLDLVPSIVATLYPRMWIDLSRTFADGGSPAEAMNCARRAIGAIGDRWLRHFNGPVFCYQVIDSAIVLASTALLHNLHVEDASKLLLQQIAICEDHLPERCDLYLLYSAAMRLLAFYHCGTGNHAEGKTWKKKVAALEYRLEEIEGPDGEIFGAVKRQIIWEESRPSTQEVKRILNVKCRHQGPVFVDDDDD